jgi:hypothetical protein
MNAQRSFDLPEHSPQRRDSPTLRQTNRIGRDAVGTTKASPRKRSRVRSNPAYAHRRQGLEVITKLVTYSTLSLFGMANLVNLISYNWSQQNKLQHLETELQDAKVRADKVNSSFSQSFDPQSQKNAIQENSYKVAPDRRQIFLVNPAELPAPQNTQSK